MEELVDVWHAENAEHYSRGKHDQGSNYTRICAGCAKKIVKVSTSGCPTWTVMKNSGG